MGVLTVSNLGGGTSREYHTHAPPALRPRRPTCGGRGSVLRHPRAAGLGDRPDPHRRRPAAGQPHECRPDPEHRPGEDGDQGLLRRHIDPSRVNPIDAYRDPHVLADGAYATEVGASSPGPSGTSRSSWDARTRMGARPAVVFDVDDTTLNTYSYEIYSNFVYNPTSNAAFVNSGVFRAVPHMVDLEHYAEAKGFSIFFLTGRPETQRDRHGREPDERGLRRAGKQALHEGLHGRHVAQPAARRRARRPSTSR